jgi:hypothetical protein
MSGEQTMDDDVPDRVMVHPARVWEPCWPLRLAKLAAAGASTSAAPTTPAKTSRRAEIRLDIFPLSNLREQGAESLFMTRTIPLLLCSVCRVISPYGG